MRRPSTLALAVFFGILAVTLIASLFTSRQVDRRADQELDERARAAATAIDRRLDTYTEKLYGVRGAFSGARNLTHAEYETFLGTQEV